MSRWNERKLHTFPGFGLVGNSLLVFLYLPLAIMVVYAFNDNHIATIWNGFTFDWFVKVFESEAIRRAAVNSFVIALISTSVGVTLAVLAAVGLLRMSLAGSGIATGLISAPLVLPEMVLAVAILALFAFVDFPLGIPAMIIGHIAATMPFALLPIRARLADLDRSVFEAASDLGANEVRIFARITLPLLVPGIVSGVLLAFIVSMDNFIMSFFTAGPGSTTLPLYIWGSLKTGLTPEVNALSTLILLLSGVILLVAQLISRKKES